MTGIRSIFQKICSMSGSRVAMLLFIVIVLQSCSSMRSAEKNYTRDPEMEIGNDAGRNFQNYVYSIREGSTPAGASKASGGCGCN